MKGTIETKSVGLYETDYQLWLDETLERLRSRDFEAVDLENLLEELEDLGKSEKNAVGSYLMRLCEQLLKVKYWAHERANCLRGWEREIANFRLQIARSLKGSPSLKNYLSDNFEPEYENGAKLFLKASGLNSTLIPKKPCFTLEQALEEDWLPS